ncbi:MAG: hypothetical protein NVSMB5_22660 [Candidatus Velthaea sp.]
MQFKRHQLLAAALILAAGLVSGASVGAAPQTENLRGTIVSSNANSLTVKTASGDVRVDLGPKVAFAGAVTGTTADIVPGKFLGIASVPGSSTNRALEVVVFADSMRGVGEGDYPWDLSAGSLHSSMTNGTVSMKAHSTMTNGTVAMKPHSTMTNATVGKMSGTAQKTITMNYKGGSRTLVVAENTPVVRLSPGTKALMVVGEPVFVVAAKTPKTPNAVFVVVREHGTALPM